MNSRRWVLAAAVSSLLLAGCDEPKQSSATAPATQPSQVQQVANSADYAKPAVPEADPTTKPAPLPEISTLLVKETSASDDLGLLYQFPRARLHINREDKTVVLYTDDPKTGIDTGYSGNSYYLAIPLEGEEMVKLDGYYWKFRAAGSEHRESADGIFCSGQRYHFQPVTLEVWLKGEGPTMQVAVIGDFMKFDTQQNNQPGALVHINGVVSAKVDSGK